MSVLTRHGKPLNHGANSHSPHYKKARFAIGLGKDGLVPAYTLEEGEDNCVQQSLPLTDPDPIKIKNPEDWQEHCIPDSFIMRWWKNRKKKKELDKIK